MSIPSFHRAAAMLGAYYGSCAKADPGAGVIEIDMPSTHPHALVARTRTIGDEPYLHLLRVVSETVDWSLPGIADALLREVALLERGRLVRVGDAVVLDALLPLSGVDLRRLGAAADAVLIEAQRVAEFLAAAGGVLFTPE